MRFQSAKVQLIFGNLLKIKAIKKSHEVYSFFYQINFEVEFPHRQDTKKRTPKGTRFF